jgi:glycine/D-amino acid oxidase-like deaminating enzyme
VGGGFTGLWAALQAKEEDPSRDVVLLEATRISQGASGRNGGFADPSLTHGLYNGMRHFPDEIDRLEALGAENYAGFLDSIERHGIDARVDQTGVLSVANVPYQVADMEEYAELLKRFEPETLFLDREALCAQLDSPT